MKIVKCDISLRFWFSFYFNHSAIINGPTPFTWYQKKGFVMFDIKIRVLWCCTFLIQELFRYYLPVMLCIRLKLTLFYVFNKCLNNNNSKFKTKVFNNIRWNVFKKIHWPSIKPLDSFRSLRLTHNKKMTSIDVLS